MLQVSDWNVLLIFNNFENFEDLILNFIRLFYKKFFEIMLIGNNCPDLFQFNERYAKVTYKLHLCKFILLFSLNPEKTKR